MAIARVKNWISGEVLFASDLNAEIDNILNNATALVSPWTANMDAGGFRLITLGAGSVSSPTLQFSGDTNTGVYSPAADQVTLVAGGVQILQASAYTSAVNFLRAVSAQSGIAPSLGATGTDTDISLSLLGTGTGFVQVGATGRSTSDRFYPGLGIGTAQDGLVAISSGTLDLIAGGRRVLQASAYSNATNYARITPSQTTTPVIWDVAGADTNIGLTIDTKGTGALTLGSADTGSITAATAFVPASIGSGPSFPNTPVQHGLYQENVVKGWINFKGTATASIYGSFNVGSLSRDGTGKYTVNWGRNFAATPYAIAGVAFEDAGNLSVLGITQAGTAMSVNSVALTTEVANSNTAADSEIVTLIAIGGQ
jgi:hypothetical protein